MPTYDCIFNIYLLHPLRLGVKMRDFIENVVIWTFAIASLVLIVSMGAKSFKGSGGNYSYQGDKFCFYSIKSNDVICMKMPKEELEYDEARATK